MGIVKRREITLKVRKHLGHLFAEKSDYFLYWYTNHKNRARGKFIVSVSVRGYSELIKKMLDAGLDINFIFADNPHIIYFDREEDFNLFKLLFSQNKAVIMTIDFDAMYQLVKHELECHP